MLEVDPEEVKHILSRLTTFGIDAMNGGTFVGMDITEEEIDDGSTIMSFITEDDEFRIIIRSVNGIMDSMTVIYTTAPTFALTLPPPTYLMREDGK